jgi:amino acid permease
VAAMAPTSTAMKTENEQAIDDWLPITSSRNAKWWYSAFHNVTAMVGAGVLSLPYAMSELGWYVDRRNPLISWTDQITFFQMLSSSLLSSHRSD